MHSESLTKKSTNIAHAWTKMRPRQNQAETLKRNIQSIS